MSRVYFAFFIGVILCNMICALETCGYSQFAVIIVGCILDWGMKKYVRGKKDMKSNAAKKRIGELIAYIRDCTEIRHILWITLVYFAAHGFLLVATGCWWDDWVYADKNWEYLFEVSKQSSLPSVAILDAGLWLFPDGFYRMLVFIVFYAGAIFFYKILNTVDLFTKKSCLWITLLYIIMPVNDARITWICWPYSFGLFAYWFAFYLSTIWINKRGKKRIALRVLSVFLLMISFTLESLMLMTLVILVYFYYRELKDDWNWKEIWCNIKKILKVVLHYLDYLIVPIAWYFGNKMLFPKYGVYGGHSYIPWSDLISITIHSPYNALVTLCNIMNNFTRITLNLRRVIFVLTIIIYFGFVSRKRKKSFADQDSEEVSWKNFVYAIYGAIIFFLGFFPYCVKRNAAIESTYTVGRDAILLGIGLSIMLYFGLQLVLKNMFVEVSCIIVILLGIVHFNLIYLDWQEDYYQQMQLQSGIIHTEEIIDNNTFLVMYQGQNACACFYQTNGNSYAATGEQTRYYMSGTVGLEDLKKMDENTWILNAYGMNEYDYTDKSIDGIIFFDYTDLGALTLLKEKWDELFNKNEFNEWISEMSRSSMKYVPLSQEESDHIWELYDDNELTDALIYEMYY